MRQLFLFGGGQRTGGSSASVYFGLRHPRAHKAVCEPQLTRNLAGISATTSHQLDRLVLELTRVDASDLFLLYLGHVAPFYALSTEGGCPPNRVNPTRLKDHTQMDER